VPRDGQSIVTVQFITAPQDAETNRAAPRQPGLGRVLRLGAGFPRFSVVLRLRSRLADLDRGVGEIRRQVVEPEVQAAIAVLEGGAWALPSCRKAVGSRSGLRK